jgi:hypothetical protein
MLGRHAMLLQVVCDGGCQISRNFDHLYGSCVRSLLSERNRAYMDHPRLREFLEQARRRDSNGSPVRL